TMAYSGYEFRALVTGILTVESNPALFLMQEPMVLDAAPNAFICLGGGSTAFEVAIPGLADGYVWSYSSNGVDYAPVANNTPDGVTYVGGATNALSEQTTAVTPAGIYYYKLTALNSV